MREDVGLNIGNAIASVLRTFIGANEPLDFRRMHRVIAAADFGGELAALSPSTASGNPITHTNEDYAVAVAKVLLLPRGEGIEILPVFNAYALIPLTKDPKSEEFRQILHLMHHELCHVHDDNKKLDAFPNVWLRHYYTGKDTYIRPLAEVCWSEYAANRMSSISAPDACVSAMTDSLAGAIQRTKSEVNREILSYRFHRNLTGLLDTFQRHGEFLPKAAAYVLGYMDGLQAPLDKLAPDVAEQLCGSYFEETWNAMRIAVEEMWRIYPSGWNDLSVYDHLAQALENYYATMGLILSTTEDGLAYVNVPLRPETTPGV